MRVHRLTAGLRVQVPWPTRGGVRVRSVYVTAIGVLSALALVFAAGILYGEATDRWFLGGGMIGALLVAYSIIVLLLRKLGLVGPRKAER